MNPLHSERKLKLGTFGTNISNALAFTTVEERFKPTWANTLAVGQLAGAMHFEAIVPVARWKGCGGLTNTGGESFETFTWATGLGALTENSCVLATCHVPTVHPLMAAKQTTTIDHITNGRFALNIVCGWVKDELELFGRSLMAHDEAYDYAAEWLEVMRKLWTIEGEFDHEGKYFSLKGAFHEPKPLQRPFPALMNAGSSEKGQHFAAKYCDMAFIQQKTPGMAALTQRALRGFARDEYQRELAFRVMAGWNGYPLVGIKEQVAEGLLALSNAGLDGCLLGWVDFEQSMRQFQRETLPLIEQMGLR